jgi:hypothetical protein
MPPPKVCAEATSAHTIVNKDNDRVVEQKLLVLRRSNERTGLFIGFGWPVVSTSRWDCSDPERKSPNSTAALLLDSSLDAMRKLTSGDFRVISP